MEIQSGKQIKEVLKKAGIDTRQVSVRHKWCGYSEVYHVTLNDEAIDIDRVKRLCRGMEYYERDERTGEILEGGNTYIYVEYHWDIRKRHYGLSEVTA